MNVRSLSILTSKLQHSSKSYLILTGLPSIFFFALLVVYQFRQSRLVLLLLLLLFWMYLALEMNKLLTLLKYIKILLYDLHQIKSNFLRKLFLFLAWLKNNSNDLGEKACLVHKINWSRYNKCQRLFFLQYCLKIYVYYSEFPLHLVPKIQHRFWGCSARILCAFHCDASWFFVLDLNLVFTLTSSLLPRTYVFQTDLLCSDICCFLIYLWWCQDFWHPVNFSAL